MARTVYEAAKDCLALLKAKEPIFAFGAGIVVVGRVAVTLSRDGSVEDRAVLAADIKRAWHEEITPLDLPGIPNFVEPALDMAIEQALSAGIDRGLLELAELHTQVDEILAKAKAA